MARRTVGTPLGPLRVEADTAVRAVAFTDGPASGPDALPDEGTSDVLDAACDELAAWFAGRATAFTVPLGPAGTPFQVRVWAALQAIPFGETRSYAELARQLGEPRGSRAVGAANGRNPIAVLIPCHRVIGSDGALVGYAGGRSRKAWLLAHERRARQPALPGVG
jgi:methylated-DNA-[protein]-cysteine S-methyltransferase